MSNHSDGEDSQMHDHHSLPPTSSSSTPSTPPASAAAHNLIPTSPPDSQSQSQQQLPSFSQSSALGEATPPISVNNTPLTSRPGVPPPDLAAIMATKPGAREGLPPPPQQQQQQQHQAAWAGKRVMEEADNAKDRCVDKWFNPHWIGDPLDESDMWRV